MTTLLEELLNQHPGWTVSVELAETGTITPRGRGVMFRASLLSEDLMVVMNEDQLVEASGPTIQSALERMLEKVTGDEVPSAY